jgi:TolB-like protein/Tfp pilus assembly protein PilF
MIGRMSIFSELQRRNVIRVALLYVVASWLIMQVVDVGISLLGLPLSTGRLVFLLLAVGFPLVVLFSWAYEITPEGLKKESEVPPDESITAHTAKKLNTAVIILLVLSLGALIADRLIPEAATPVAEPVADAVIEPGVPGQSIAVLPFVNMSADKENEYFSDGLSEELLNLLARIPELQVAARTSAFSFKGTDAAIGEIAEKLNVAHVLEGSVRKSGDEIRITAQLIKASDGYHLWSHTWDRTLIDVFAIQDEIAAAVVEALKVTLLGDVPHARVTDPAAYSLYLQSKVASNKRSKESLEEAVAMLTQALAIDPDYAEAWVELGTVQTNQTGSGFVPETEGFGRARASAERALSIDPDNARAISNLAWLAMYADWDFTKAAELLARARRLEPGNASILNTYAVLNGIFGRRDSMLSLYQEALTSDPLSMSVLTNTGGTFFGTDRLREMNEIVERVRQIDAESDAFKWLAGLYHLSAGNAEASADQFQALGGVFGAFGSALAYYDLGRDTESDESLQILIDAEDYSIQVAVVHAYRQDFDTAFEWLDRAYEEHSDEMVEIRMYQPLDPMHSDPRWENLLGKIGISDSDARRAGL